jgi:hypothetical protein
MHSLIKSDCGNHNVLTSQDPASLALQLVNRIYPVLLPHFHSSGWKESFGVSPDEKEVTYDWSIHAGVEDSGK